MRMIQPVVLMLLTPLDLLRLAWIAGSDLNLSTL
ncbi:hypothetical protein BH18ACT6_BH18ACT6_16940 [soil metagenome]